MPTYPDRIDVIDLQEHPALAARVWDRGRADAGARGAGADPQGGGRSLRHQARTGGAHMIRLAAIAGLCLLCASLALAQGYPNKPIRLMVGYTAGRLGRSRRAAARARRSSRCSASRWCSSTGRAPPAAWRWKRSPRRRPTATRSTTSTAARSPSRRTSPRSATTTSPRSPTSATCAAAAACWWCIRRRRSSTVQEVVELSKQDPNKWSYGTSGVGGPHHLSGEYFKSVTGAEPAARAVQGRRPGDDRPDGRPDPDAVLLARPGGRRGEGRQDPRASR